MHRGMVLGGVLLLGACSTPEPTVEITVAITGAITRDGAYVHAADDSHGCRELRVYGSPGDDAPPHITTWEIRFDPAAEMPAASFLLQFDLSGRPEETVVWLTAGGRRWIASGASRGFRAEIHPAEGMLTGRFRLTGLRAYEGGTETIDVTGRWRCPPEDLSP